MTNSVISYEFIEQKVDQNHHQYYNFKCCEFNVISGVNVITEYKVNSVQNNTTNRYCKNKELNKNAKNSLEIKPVFFFVKWKYSKVV